MSLPVFDTPIYSVTLPGSGETVKYRPFLVKEQKQLLMVANADSNQQNEVIEATIDACTFGKVNPTKLASFDVEFLFMQIRARSVGEFVDMVLTCECGAKQDARLDLTKVEVEKSKDHSISIDLGAGNLIKMCYPKLRDVDTLAADNSVDGVLRMIATSIDSIWQGDTLFNATDYSVDELITFVENLSPEALAKIERFFETMPVLRHKLDWDCKECGKHNEVVLEGIQSFFG